MAAAAPMASVSSPDRQLTVSIEADRDGRLSYRVDRAGVAVVRPSRLGLLLSNAPPLDGGFERVDAVTSDVDETWEQPWGETRRIRNHYRELRLDLNQPKRDGRRLTVRVRVHDDGIGFRYEVPDQPQWPVTRISDELTEFDIDEPAEAWWTPAGGRLVAEYDVQHTPLREVALATTPLTMRTASGLHLSLHEAALVDYASMWVRRSQGQTLRAQLVPSATGPAVERHGAFVTPWRTLQVSDSAAGLLSSSLILNLNEPNKLGDVSWFRPGKFVGVWWEMHLGRSTWGSGPQHGATTANAKRHIDFAARNGFGGVLIEGWNQGWDADWPGDGGSFDFLAATPDFDLPAVTAYAAKRGVRVVGHHETGGNIAHYERQMAAAYRRYAELGVQVVKSGYVADAGAARFQDAQGGGTHLGFTESQEGVRHYQRAVEAAAPLHLAINTHEPVKDTGLRRTYPNWVSREGARGQEFNAWGEPINQVDHEIKLLFTRMLSGPMDYTPGILSLEGAKGVPILSTQARQLALFVVLYSPVVMVPDLIEHYERYPAAFQFIKDVPTDWEQTKVLSAAVGQHAVIARQQRGGEDWFVGAITDGEARVTDVALDFLTPGQRYEAQIYRDGDKADYRDAHRFDLVAERRVVRAGDRLTLRMAPGGGWAVGMRPIP